MKNINVCKHISTWGFWFWCFTLRYNVNVHSNFAHFISLFKIYCLNSNCWICDISTVTGTTTSSMSNSSSNGLNMRTCVGCGGQIHDQYILRVAPNLEWHAACLKCSQCQKFLDEKCTCFVRDGKCCYVYIITSATLTTTVSSLSNSRLHR